MNKIKDTDFNKVKSLESCKMNDDDFKLLRSFDYRHRNRQTFVNVESLSRLKIYNRYNYLMMFLEVTSPM